jgi:hypothetical protein
MIRVGFWWRFFTVTARERERVRCGDVRLQGEFDTGRFCGVGSLPSPFSFPFF